LAAPVVDEPRYENRPIYFSDVVVRADSPAASFADLRGASWCYNEPSSHSGYMTVLHHLVRMGESPSFFRRFDATGFHQESMRLVADGTYDASAIDSHLLAVMRRRTPGLTASLRVIESIGPSPIQPVVAADHVPADVREAMADVLTSMRGPSLHDAHVSRYERVTDADYDAIRAMAAAVADAGCFLA
jgi:phosphonate transport system substrate-binding protein